MARPKKDAVPLNMRVDAAVMKRFNEYCEEVGQTKTLAFERIISAHIDKYEQGKKRTRKRKEKEE